MAARGFVEGRRAGTPDAKFTDHEIGTEDARLQTRDAKACAAHLADLIGWHGSTCKNKEPSTPLAR